MPKTITLLGSTGSIGTQSLDVARMHGYRIFGLAANSRVEILQSRSKSSTRNMWPWWTLPPVRNWMLPLPVPPTHPNC